MQNTNQIHPLILASMGIGHSMRREAYKPNRRYGCRSRRLRNAGPPTNNRGKSLFFGEHREAAMRDQIAEVFAPGFPKDNVETTF